MLGESSTVDRASLNDSENFNFEVLEIFVKFLYMWNSKASRVLSVFERLSDSRNFCIRENL